MGRWCDGSLDLGVRLLARFNGDGVAQLFRTADGGVALAGAIELLKEMRPQVVMVMPVMQQNISSKKESQILYF